MPPEKSFPLGAMVYVTCLAPPETKEKEMAIKNEERGMNLRNVVAALDEEVRTIGTRIISRQGGSGRPTISTPPTRKEDLECVHQTSGHVFTCKIDADLYDRVRVGDYVLIDTKFGLYMAEVAEKHDVPNIDPTADFEYKWAFQKVDLANLFFLNRRDILNMETVERESRKTRASTLKETLGLDPNFTIKPIRRQRCND